MIRSQLVVKNSRVQYKSISSIILNNNKKKKKPIGGKGTSRTIRSIYVYVTDWLSATVSSRQFSTRKTCWARFYLLSARSPNSKGKRPLFFFFSFFFFFFSSFRSVRQRITTIYVVPVYTQYMYSVQYTHLRFNHGWYQKKRNMGIDSIQSTRSHRGQSTRIAVLCILYKPQVTL